MPLLDHFHPPLHGPRRWEGFRVPVRFEESYLATCRSLRMPA